MDSGGLGNQELHELNAIAWFLPDPDQPGDSPRSHHSPRYGEKNYLQHKAFLNEVGDTPLHAEVIDWFLCYSCGWTCRSCLGSGWICYPLKFLSVSYQEPYNITIGDFCGKRSG